jgi:hypothetical protein
MPKAGRQRPSMTCLVFELTSISASMELNVKMWILVW